MFVAYLEKFFIVLHTLQDLNFLRVFFESGFHMFDRVHGFTLIIQDFG